VFLINSRLGLVCATQRSSARVARHRIGSPFSRSYGGNLPSSLTRVLSIALVSSTYLPVSVCGTDTRASSLRGFSGQYGPDDSSPPQRALVPPLPLGLGDFPPRPGYRGTRTMSSRLARISPAASPHHSTRVVTEYKPFVHRLRLAASA
jgi:hypothetical protein